MARTGPDTCLVNMEEKSKEKGGSLEHHVVFSNLFLSL